MSKWSECTHIRCVCARARSGSCLTEGVSEAWCWRNVSSANGGISQSDRLMQIPKNMTKNMTLYKKRYKYCSFSHTNCSFRVLGHQCVVTMGNCLILISLCMFFFPLIETVTYTCHYMTDRLERFDLKTSKLDLLKKKRHLHLGCPWVSW